jgi:hypothetical protein
MLVFSRASRKILTVFSGCGTAYRYDMGGVSYQPEWTEGKVGRKAKQQARRAAYQEKISKLCTAP